MLHAVRYAASAVWLQWRELPREWWDCWSVALQPLASIWIVEVGGQRSWEIYVFTASRNVFFSQLNHPKFIEKNAAGFIQKDSFFVDLFLFFKSCPIRCWILTGVFAVGEGLKHSNKFYLLSPNYLSESQFPAILWKQGWRSNFPGHTNDVYHRTGYHPDFILKFSDLAWKNKAPWIPVILDSRN